MQQIQIEIPSAERSAQQTEKTYEKFFKFVGFILSILWGLFLLVLICLPMDKVHDIIESMYSDATQLTDKDAPNCSFTWSNIKSNADLFLFFHFARHFVHAMVLRNRSICWIVSVLWEILEACMTNISALKLESIHECWFDQLFFDILMMNALGIEVGLYLNRKLGWNDYEMYQVLMHRKWYKCNKNGYAWLVIYISIMVIQLEQAFIFMLFLVALWIQNLATWLFYLRQFTMLFPFVYGVRQVNRFVCNQRNGIKQEDIIGTIRSLYWLLIGTILLILEFVLIVKGYAQY